MKTTTLAALAAASLALLLTGCDNAATPAATDPPANPAPAKTAPEKTAEKPPALPAANVEPSPLVKSLYAAQKAGHGPFFQTADRAVVDRYFTKELADRIWNDAVEAKGEVGAIEFDPLYGSQDPQIAKFVIMDTGWGGDKKFGPEDEAVVQVTFTDSGKERMVSYQFKQGKDRVWRIYDIHYRGAGDEVRLADVLKQAQRPAR